MTNTTPSVPPSAVVTPVTDGGRFEWHQFGSGATGRRYKLYVPAAYDSTRAAPLVVLLHGCTQDPDDLARGTRMNEAAERAGVLVAYPEQPATANALKCWRWFEAAQQRRDGDEVSVVEGITRDVMRSYHIDARRVHVAGISAGAAMALLVAAAHPELYASAASHSGVPIGAASTAEAAWAVMKTGVADDAGLAARYSAYAGQGRGRGGRAIPLLVIHGAADNVVTVRNGRQTAQQWASVFGLTPRETIATEVASSDPNARSVERTVFARAGGGEPIVELAVVSGLGHAWSGGSRAGTFADEAGPAASAMMLEFFARHPMDGGGR